MDEQVKKQRKPRRASAFVLVFIDNSGIPIPVGEPAPEGIMDGTVLRVVDRGNDIVTLRKAASSAGTHAILCIRDAFTAEPTTAVKIKATKV